MADLQPPGPLRFSAVILAGGWSRRMGRDKAWLELDGQPLIRRQIRLAREVGAQEVFISGRPDADYSSLGCPMLPDRFSEAGPLAGIERALASASQPLLLVLAVDLPRLTGDIVRWLLAHCRAEAGAIPQIAGRIEPLAACYARAAWSLAEARLARQQLAVQEFARECVTAGFARFVGLPADSAEAFANWNTPEDME